LGCRGSTGGALPGQLRHQKRVTARGQKIKARRRSPERAEENYCENLGAVCASVVKSDADF
jgi:hypothetical protein